MMSLGWILSPNPPPLLPAGASCESCTTPTPWHSLHSQGFFLATGRSCTWLSQQHGLSGVAPLPAVWPHDSFSITRKCTFFPMKMSLVLLWCLYSHIVHLHLVIPESEGKQEWEKNPHLTSQMIAATVSMAGLPSLIPLAFCSFVPNDSVWRLCYSRDCWRGDSFHKRWEGKEREEEEMTMDGFFLFFLPYWPSQVREIFLSLLKDGY